MPGAQAEHAELSYNLFASLQWMLDGRSVAGLPTRGLDETPTRLEALRIYTQGSAWFVHDDDRRGSLAVSKLADLAALSGDCLAAPIGEIGALHSLLTMVGGRIVYAAGPYAAFEDRPDAR